MTNRTRVLSPTVGVRTTRTQVFKSQPEPEPRASNHNQNPGLQITTRTQGFKSQPEPRASNHSCLRACKSIDRAKSRQSIDERSHKRDKGTKGPSICFKSLSSCCSPATHLLTRQMNYSCGGHDKCGYEREQESVSIVKTSIDRVFHVLRISGRLSLLM